MAKNLKILFALVAISLFLVSCKSEQTELTGRFKRAQVPKPAPAGEAASADIVKKEVLDGKVSRRNPF